MTVDEAIKRATERVTDRITHLDQRTISRLSVASAIVLVVLVVLVVALLRGQPTSGQLAGADLGGTPAPGFSLVDQNGQTLTLQSLRGHPVALTFMYTHCLDVCPVTAEKLHQASAQLGTQASAVEWIGISVDPAGDTPASATQFAATHGLTGRIHFLLGSRAQLLPIWQAYYLVPSNSTGQQPQVADHTGAVYLIDKQGRERVYLDSTFDPVKQLAPDLRILLSS
ncbi:MAG TPA: SCO family protein [Ktedonobacterales bacterium]